MKRVLKVVSALVVAVFLQVMLPSSVFALTPGAVFADAGTVYFGITDPQQPANTCLYQAYLFKFPATTPSGKTWLALLLGAKLTGKQITLAYTPASNGGGSCTANNMSEVNGIQIQ